MVLSGEHDLLLVYYLQNTPEDWDGESVRMVSADTEGEPIAIVKLVNCYAHMFGPPNEEAFDGHPLSDRGVQPFSVFEVKNSSWLRGLEVMNSVHPYHDKNSFLNDKKHYIFSFHDTTFECIAGQLEWEVVQISVKDAILQNMDWLR